ncbi:MAG: NIPSNAP family protein [Pseudomonadota bacterium]
MLLEFRFNRLRPRSIPEYQTRFEQALAERALLSPLLGFWTTEVGNLDEVVELWAYDDAAHRDHVRAQAARLQAWSALEACDLHQAQVSQWVASAPFSPPAAPGAYGALYELRIYDYETDAIARVLPAWEKKLPGRIELSPLMACGHSVSGAPGQWLHLWAYENAAERQRIRSEAVRRNCWPPESPGGLIGQRNMLLVPSAFSPWR